MEIIDIVKQVLAKFASALPNLVGAIVIILLGLIISKIVAKTLEKVFSTIKIDRLGEKINETEFAQKSNLKIRLSVFLAKLVYYVLMLIFLMAATDVLGMPIVSEMVSDLISYLPRLLSALVLFVLGIYLAEFVKNIVLATCNALAIPSAKVIANFVFYLIFLTLTISALAQASIETSLITSNLTVILGGVLLAFAIGYGFASKDTMANFLASFYSKNKVKIGDVISIDGSTGKIIAMDSSSLTLQGDGKIIVIPLKKLTSEKVEIFSNERQIK
ncbi:MAG: mechanosensitive ion channel [Lewinellaceae bacterium]|nr:mechanosensitive ion channel [Saprospiraceae bacterium]MCB9338105.1 mechanosensitive ion channel [Lewinellaceae bacterium]